MKELANQHASALTRAQFLRSLLSAALLHPLVAVTGARAETPAAFTATEIAPGVPPASRLPAASGGLIAAEHPLVPVKVSASRVIRTVVGLRPYRPSGFVVKAQPFSGKTLVHNYGHGGGGVSLSWGCATLAADLLIGKSPSHAAVIGAGVIGLSTARILQDRGWQVTIYAENVPPHTTSNIAGARWKPTSVFKREQITSDFKDSFVKAAHIAHRSFQLMAGPLYGVRWIDNYALSNQENETDSLDDAILSLTDLFPDMAKIDPASTPFAAKYVKRFQTMLIEPNIYLPAIMRDFFLRGGKLCVRKFDSYTQWHHLPEKVIFNCTGLGAKTLLDDAELEPVRGQLTILEPQSNIDYITLADSLYMFPRADGIVLGGTFEHGNWSLDPDMQTQSRILTEHAALYRS